MDEVMYNHSSVLIVLVVLVAMIGALELGVAGARRKQTTDESRKSQLNAVQGSLLGLLALLLGFTFSLSLQRFDDRSRAVVDEANAIGTAWLRAQNLEPEVLRAEALRELDSYVDLRVRSNKVSLNRESERQELIASANASHGRLWALTGRALAADDRMTTTGLFIQSLNEVVDAYGRRDAALNRHVPEAVLFLLLLTFVLVSAIVGYTSGASGSRPPAPALIMLVLITLLLFLIIDLDRPRRGLIEVNQHSLVELQTTIRGTAMAGSESAQ